MTDGGRVYLRRRGRETKAQARALENLLPLYGLTADQLSDPDVAFDRDAPLALEIGFGMGQALLELAEQRPELNCLGIDVYRPGIGSLLNGCSTRGLSNVRVAEGDARELVARLPEASLRACHVYFPDPWPKKRHHKRRLLNHKFLELLSSCLEAGGRLHVATDWAPYAQDILASLHATRGLKNCHDAGFAPRGEDRPVTRFEARGTGLGHEIHDLEFERSHASLDELRDDRIKEPAPE